jgi:hypothetical protein
MGVDSLCENQWEWFKIVSLIIKVRWMNLNEETILKALDEVEYSANDFLSQADLIDMLDTLNGEPFDKDTFD